MKNFEDILRKNNMKITKGRLALLEELNKSQVPMNTEEIFETADKDAIPSFTSLYRMLNELSDKGIIRKIYTLMDFFTMSLLDLSTDTILFVQSVAKYHQ